MCGCGINIKVTILAVALAGLPVLLALGGRRSLSDLMSASRTRRSELPG